MTLKVKTSNSWATEQAIDTSSASGKAFLDMFGVFAEFETRLRQERQREGIVRAKDKSAYEGRKPTARAQIQRLPDIKRLPSKTPRRRPARRTGKNPKQSY